MEPGSVFRIRGARAEDEEPLLRVDRATWSPRSSPSPAPPEGPFFNERTRFDNVWVAELDGDVVGYAKMDHPTPLPASDHVWHVTGLAVDPHVEGRGIGQALMETLIDEARARGGLKMTLRVFAPNERAQRLYKRLGFEAEGVLRGEFRQGDALIDDVLMARRLA
jgi:ribosomal protein S18 acetylase RimI-like enzyme